MCIAYQSGSKTIDYVKLSDELGNKITLDGCKIINIKDATTANADWADMGYDLSPYLIGDSDFETKFINIQKNIWQFVFGWWKRIQIYWI